MKILLVLPRTKGSFDVYKQSLAARLFRIFSMGNNTKGNIFLPPLGLLTVASLTPDEDEVRVVDEKVGDRLDYDADVDLVGIGLITSAARRGYEIADEFRKRGRRVVLGGFHVFFDIDNALQHADAVVVGEAEPVWKDLVEDARSGSLKKIYGAGERMPFEYTPIPRFDLIDRDKYGAKYAVQFTRGCPHSCDFCCVRSYFGKTIRVKPVQQVLRELGPLREGELVIIVDDNIIADPGAAKELFKALIPLNIKWFSQCSLSIADDKELLGLAAESGCFCLLVGIESIQAENFRHTMGKIIPGKLEEQLDRIHEAGIGINGSFMLGLDGDTPETFECTADFCIRNNIELPSFNVFSPMPGTPVYNRMKADGRFTINGFGEYEDIIYRRKLFYTPKGMSEKEYYEGFDRMCRKVFSYPSILSRNLKYRNYFVDYLFLNYLWRKCDLQLGQRSFTNLIDT